jgi:hypothetical protein
MWGQALALPIIPETIKGKAYSHVSYRYLIVVINGVKNPYRRAVAKDVVDVILKSRATKGSTAQYWDRDEQSKRLTEMYNKWSVKGGVWSAAASKVCRLEGGGAMLRLI